MKGHFLCPHGLEVLVDHGNTDVQDWRGEQLRHKGRFYNNSEQLVQKCADGEVSTVVPEDPLSQAEFPMSISKVGPQGVQPNAPRYKLQQSTGLYRHQSTPFYLQPSSGLQIFNVLFRGEGTYESSMRASVALYGGHIPAGMQTKDVDVSWDLNSVACP